MFLTRGHRAKDIVELWWERASEALLITVSDVCSSLDTGGRNKRKG
jgi:hypothetical protein